MGRGGAGMRNIGLLGYDMKMLFSGTGGGIKFGGGGSLLGGIYPSGDWIRKFPDSGSAIPP